jgi:hypothetical protein
MAVDNQFSPERIADRMEITGTLLRWCRGIDRLDLHQIRDVFHPDATDNHGIALFDVDGLFAWISERHKKISLSLHRISNMLIEFAAKDIALVESYVDAYRCYPPGGGAALAQITGEHAGKVRMSERSLGLQDVSSIVSNIEMDAGRSLTVIFESALVFEMPRAVSKDAPN